MEKLETEVKEKEAEFITFIQNVLSQNCADRIKIEKIHRQHYKTLNEIENLISNFKVE